MLKNLSFDNKVKIVRSSLQTFVFAALFYLLITPLYSATLGVKVGDALFSALCLFFIYVLFSLNVEKRPMLIAGHFDSLKRVAGVLLIALCGYPGIFLLIELLVSGPEFIRAIVHTIPLRGAFSFVVLYIVYLNSKNRAATKEIEAIEPGIVTKLSEQITQESGGTEEKMEILDRIAVKIRDKIVVIPIEVLCYLKADGDYVQLHTMGASYLKEQTMKYFENSLPPDQFVRVHRSYIVNIEMISGIEQYGKQTRQVKLKNGDKIMVSATGYKILRTKLKL